MARETIDVALGGWDRVGLVMTLFWVFISCLTLGQLAWSPETEARYVTERLHCIDLKESEVDGCRKAADVAFVTKQGKEARDFWRYDVPIFITIPPLLIWGFVSMIVSTVNWIREGFAGK